MNIIDKKTFLTSAQKSLLEKCALSPFVLGDYKSLDDIVTKLMVEVHIKPGIPERSLDNYYDRAIDYLGKKLDQIREMMREDESLWNEYKAASEKLVKLSLEKKTYSSMRLLGQYDSQNNIIILYPEAMADADASKMDEYLVSTFAHEVMHAYFNRPGHEQFPYAMFVEEPLAEYGMLLYLYETNSPYYNWAHDNISGKKCCYRYGADMMDQYLGGNKSLRNSLEDYKTAIGKYDMLDIIKGRILMPGEGVLVNVDDHKFVVKWIPVFSVPPTYFWDNETKTLGLNGDWRGIRNFLSCINISRRYLREILHLYLGKDFVATRWFNSDFFFIFSCGFESLFSNVPLSISPHNKEFTITKGILVRKKDRTPLLRSCGDDLYVLMRAGKYSIIDSQLNPITSNKYDRIGNFDENNLCEVRVGHHHGLVNKQGKEQVPVIYEDITKEGHLYKVKLNGKVFIIDEFGKKQIEKEE